jgi:hypothetical protein
MHLLLQFVTNISNFIPIHNCFISIIQLPPAMPYGIAALNDCGAILDRAGQFLNMRDTTNQILSDITEASNEDQYEERPSDVGSNSSETLQGTSAIAHSIETPVSRKKRKISHGNGSDFSIFNPSIDESRSMTFSFAPPNLRIVKDGTKNANNAIPKAPVFPFHLPQTKDGAASHGHEDDILDDSLIPTRGLRRKQDPETMAPQTRPASITISSLPKQPSRKLKSLHSRMATGDANTKVERQIDHVVPKNTINNDLTMENRGDFSKKHLVVNLQTNIQPKDSMEHMIHRSHRADVDDGENDRPPTPHGPIACVQTYLDSRTRTPRGNQIYASNLITGDDSGVPEQYHGTKAEQPAYTPSMRRIPPQDIPGAPSSQTLSPLVQIASGQPNATARNVSRRVAKIKSNSTIAVQLPNQELPGPQARAMQVLMWTMQKEENHRKEQEAKMELLHNKVEALENEKQILTDKVSTLAQEKSQLHNQVEDSEFQLQKFKEVATRLNESTIGLQKDLRNCIDKQKNLKQESNALKIEINEWKSQAQKAKLAVESGGRDVKMLKDKYSKRYLSALKAIDSSQDEYLALQGQFEQREQLLNFEIERAKHLEQLQGIIIAQQPQDNNKHALEVQRSISTRLEKIETSLKSLDDRASPMQELLGRLQPLIIALQSSFGVQKDDTVDIGGLLESIQLQ